MARIIHKNLGYEKRSIAKKMYQIRILSDLLYELDKKFKKERLEQVIWTWEGGITFKNLNKEEFKKVKTVLKSWDLSQLEKTSNEDGIKLEGTIAEKYLKSKHGDIKVRVYIDFNWSLPETCTITYKTSFKKLNKDKYQMINGELHEEVITTEIDCKKPVLSSVFDAAEA